MHQQTVARAASMIATTIVVAAVLLAALLRPASTERGPGSPLPPDSPAGAGATGGADDPTTSDSDTVASKDGLTLTVQAPAIVIPGTPAQFVIELHNDREVAADLGTNGCFANVHITASLPVDQTEPSLTRRQADFRAWLLANAYGPGGVDGDALAPVDLTLAAPCQASSPGSEKRVGPGATLRVAYSWPGDYARGFYIPPGPVAYRVSVGYDLQNGPPSYPPGYTGILGSWIPIYKQLTVNGRVQIAGRDPVAIGGARAVDAAMEDERFWAFASQQPLSQCIANLLPMEENGFKLPAGPAWVIELICDAPRRFVRAAVDPYTAWVTGVDLCLDPCSR